MKCPEKVDILIFIDWYLPGYKAGGPIVSCANMVRALSAKYNVAVVSSDRDYLDEAPYPNIQCDKWSRLENVWVYYLSPSRAKYATIADLLRINTPRVVYINGIFSRVFSAYPLLAARRGVTRIVVAPRGMLAPGALGLKSLKKSTYLALAKGLGLYRKVTFQATHAHEAEHIRQRIDRNVAVVVLPNLPTVPSIPAVLPPKAQNQLHILMVARVAPEKNVHFALRCLAQVPEEMEVTLTHVGPVYDEAYFVQCKAVPLPAHVSVRWMGPLPSQAIAAFYRECHLFFLPTLGENYGHAIAEALLHGMPVLISNQTPWTGLEKDGLGADLPLASEAPFTSYLCSMAALSTADFVEATSGIASRTLRRLDFEKDVRAYNTFFA